MGTKMERLLELQEAIGYRFKDERLLVRALTHTSRGGEHNQRLEFLGDAVVGLYAARLLYAVEPELNEGEMSRARAAAVCETRAVRSARLSVWGNICAWAAARNKAAGVTSPRSFQTPLKRFLPPFTLMAAQARQTGFLSAFCPCGPNEKAALPTARPVCRSCCKAAASNAPTAS